MQKLNEIYGKYSFRHCIPRHICAPQCYGDNQRKIMWNHLAQSRQQQQKNPQNFVEVTLLRHLLTQLEYDVIY